MGKINWTRVFVCRIVTGVVWTVTSAISTWYVGGEFNAAVPGNKIFAPSPGLATFLFAVNLGGGIWAMWLYASIRPRYGAGAQTALEFKASAEGCRRKQINRELSTIRLDKKS